MRRIHAKFVAISAAASAANNAGGEDGEGADVPTTGPPAGSGGDVDGTDDAEADAVDERPWPVPRPSRKSVIGGSIDMKPDIGELAAEKCIQWVDRKILEHVGFQGMSGLLSYIYMNHSHGDMYAQAHHSWRWMCYRGSQWSTCRMSGAHSASISISILI